MSATLREANSTMSLLVPDAETDASTIDTHQESTIKRTHQIPSSGFNDEENSIEGTDIGLYAILVVCAAAVGGFMFGYDTACISSILVFLDGSEKFQLTAEQKELVTGITSVGSFFGSVGASAMADFLGRRLVIAVCCVVFAAAAVQLALSQSVPAMVVGRFVVGLAVGAASMVVPVYISEVGPSRQRGRLLVLNSLSTTGGQLMANLTAYLVASSTYNWRLMFSLSGVPPLLFLIAVGFIPESPRYLVLKKEYTTAEHAIKKLYPNATHHQVRSKVVSIIDDIEINETQHSLPVYTRLFGIGSTRRALVVGCALMFYQQISSFNSFMYYGATIFEGIGVGDPIVVSILISATNFGFTFVALKYIDKVGRRSMLLRTVWIMAVALFVAGIVFLKVGSTVKDGVKVQVNLDGYAISLIISVLTFVASYASALGTVPWFSVEFLPLEARAPGSALIASTGWLTNAMMSVTYLTLVEWTSETTTCMTFGTICLLGWFAVRQWYPEVKGLSLEEIRNVFEDGVDIDYGETLRQQKILLQEDLDGSRLLRAAEPVTAVPTAPRTSSG